MCALEPSAKQRHTTWRQPPMVGIFRSPETLSASSSTGEQMQMQMQHLLDASPACTASDPALWMQRLWAGEWGGARLSDCPRAAPVHLGMQVGNLEALGQESRVTNGRACMSSKVMCFICLM